MSDSGQGQCVLLAGFPGGGASSWLAVNHCLWLSQCSLAVGLTKFLASPSPSQALGSGFLSSDWLPVLDGLPSVLHAVLVIYVQH